MLHNGLENDSPTAVSSSAAAAAAVVQQSPMGSSADPMSSSRPSKPSWRKIMVKRRRQTRRRLESLRHQMDYEQPALDNDNIFKSSESVESWNNNSSSNEKVTSLMAACHLGLEHNVSKILWKKVRRQADLETFFNVNTL